MPHTPHHFAPNPIPLTHHSVKLITHHSTKLITHHSSLITQNASFCGTTTATAITHRISKPLQILLGIVVGYVNNAETVAGKNIVAPVFVTVGQNTIALSSIRLTKKDGSDCTTGLNILNTITDQGAVGVQYTWTSAGRTTKRWFWACNGVEITPENDIYLPQGASLVFSAEAEGVTIKTAGEVQMSDAWTFSNSVAGKNLIANPYATVQKLSKIRLTKSDGSDCTTGLNILNTITDQGAVGVQYTWTSAGRTTKRWFWACNGVEITADNDVDIPAGAGLVFSAEANGVKMTFNQK